MRLVIVDDDYLVSSSLKIILEAEPDFHVLGMGKNGMEGLSLYRAHQPDVLLMDIRMDGMNGLECATAILQEFPDAKILLLTTFSDDEYIIHALKIGTKGYLLKQDYAHIIPAIKAVFLGQTVFGDEIVSKIPNLLHASSNYNYKTYHITEKEFEIIKYIADGLSNKEISEQLFLSEGTVRNYLSSILEKLSLRDRTQLAVFYYRHL